MGASCSSTQGAGLERGELDADGAVAGQWSRLSCRLAMPMQASERRTGDVYTLRRARATGALSLRVARQATQRNVVQSWQSMHNESHKLLSATFYRWQGWVAQKPTEVCSCGAVGASKKVACVIAFAGSSEKTLEATGESGKNFVVRCSSGGTYYVRVLTDMQGIHAMYVFSGRLGGPLHLSPEQLVARVLRRPAGDVDVRVRVISEESARSGYALVDEDGSFDVPAAIFLLGLAHLSA